jgi:hypothetical protein
MALANTGFFNRRGDLVPKIGRAEELKEAAFSLAPDRPYAEKSFFAGDAFYLIGLKDKKDAGQDLFRAEEETFRRTVLRKKQNEIFRVWLENTKKGYKVDIAEKAL